VLAVLICGSLLAKPLLARLNVDQDVAFKYATLAQSLTSSITKLMTEDEVPGVAIGLVDGQQVVWAHGFGVADLAKQTPVTPDTIFSLQSISKSYTATAFLRAVDRKAIGLDDRLIDMLPGFTVRDRFGGKEARRITMRHLLAHWAGLCQEAPVGNNYGDWHCGFAEHIESIKDTWLRSPVGSRYRYSNLGIDLAGFVLSKRLGMPFEDLMQAELLRPLGMRDSSFRRSDLAGSNRIATGYIDLKSPVPELEIPMVAAGGLYSTVNDMTKYVRFQLAGGRLNGEPWISPKAIRTMITPQFSEGPRGRGYGLGIQSRPFHGGRLCTHGGGGYGFGTIQSWMPDYQIGVVVLTNGDQGGDLSEEVARDALEGMIWIKKGHLPDEAPYVHDRRPEISLAPSQLQRYAGTYKATSGLAEFRVEGGKLHFHRQHNDVTLLARSPTEFTDAAMTQSYRFDLGSDGAPTGVLQLGDVGQDYMVLNDRVGEPRGPDRPEWREFVGDYTALAYGQTVNQKVTLRNGYLYWADSLKLFPHQDRLFFTADGEAVVFGDRGMTYGNRAFTKKG